MKIGILGSGAWGAALTYVLARNGHHVTVWAHSAESAQQFDAKKNPGVTTTTNLELALNNSYVVIAISLNYLRQTLESARASIQPETVFIIGSKGMDKQTLLFPYQMLEQWGITKYAVLSGPSFAKDILEDQPTAVMLACKNAQISNAVTRLFEHELFCIFPTTDVIGVSCAGVYKNIAALGMGMLTGLGYRDNTKAWFFARAAQELNTLMHHMQGSHDTLYSLAGIGDLVLTCYSTTSKNFTYGYKYVQKKSAPTDMSVPEGINSLICLYNQQQHNSIILPIAQQLYQIILAGEAPESLVKLLTCPENNNQF